MIITIGTWQNYEGQNQDGDEDQEWDSDEDQDQDQDENEDNPVLPLQRNDERPPKESSCLLKPYQIQ